jgi:hypothetical protein
MNTSQDQEIEIFVNNVVSSFALGCQLNLRKIAMEAAHVIYKRDQAVDKSNRDKKKCERERERKRKKVEEDEKNDERDRSMIYMCFRRWS